MSKDGVIHKAEEADKAVKELESQVKRLRKVVSEKQAIQSEASQNLRMNDLGGYQILWEARRSLRSARQQLLPRETELRQLRQELYNWNQMVKASKTKDIDDWEPASNSGTPKYTRPTWLHPATEDKTEMLDLSDLSQIMTNSRGKRRAISYAGTDYGVCTMSETVALTEDQIKGHLNRYWQLQGLADTLDNADDPAEPPVVAPHEETIVNSGHSHKDMEQSLKLPKAYKITAPQIDH
ncbi:hypothetical protein BGX27_005686, partial [Mortierella sp. AM989]